MERMTKILTDGSFCLESKDNISEAEDCYRGDAITRLGLFESAYENLVGNQAEMSAELERLRIAGKKSSAQFRELMGKKLVASNALTIFKLYGIK